MAEIADRFIRKPSGPTDEDAKPYGSTNEEDEKRIRARFAELLPPEASQPLPSPSETQEMLAKISRYETALRNSISRTLNTLIGLQNMRTERAERRRLKLLNHQVMS